MTEAGGSFMLALAERLAHWGAVYHRASLKGLENLPSSAALLIGNHGLFGWDTPTFFHLLREHTGRIPCGLADRYVFGIKPIRELIERAGSVIGTRENALAHLRENRLVVCYPGGSREVFKAPDEKYRIQWQRTTGFAEVAYEASVPVVPFAGIGVDDAFFNFGHVPFTRSLLGRYAAPLAIGIGALPLPTRFRFVLGPPLRPTDFSSALDLKRATQRSVEALLASCHD